MLFVWAPGTAPSSLLHASARISIVREPAERELLFHLQPRKGRKMAWQSSSMGLSKRHEKSARWLFILPLMLACPGGEERLGSDDERSPSAGSGGPSIAGVTAHARLP